MKFKTIRMNADRHARLKALAHEAGFKTMGKYLENLLDSPAKEVGQPRQSFTQQEIDDEVDRLITERLKTFPPPGRVGDLAKIGMREEAPSHPTRTHTLEDCARTMIDMLPEATRDFAHEVCEHILHIQPSQLIHGHLMNAADSGLLQSPHIDPSWEQRKVEERAGKSICEWPECRQPFEPDHYGQRYCGNICGGKAATEMLPKPAMKTQPILDAPGMQNLIAV